MVSTGSPILGVAVGLGVGLVAGIINGLLISYFKFNSIVITLGALSVWGGLALLLTGGRTVAGLPSEFTMLGTIRILGISLDTFVLILAIVYGFVMLNILPYGRKLRAVGGSNRAAFLMGVPVVRVQLLMFVQVGLAASIAGLILVAKLASATPITGQGLEITALTVVLLGGVAFTGGVGSISGVLAGLIFVGLLRNGLVFMGTSQFLQQILIGFTLIAAVVFDETVRRLSNSPSRWKKSANKSKQEY
jgi:ribose/xylose/arabinose/galactoside ABC-type transport system permease subunit